MVECFYHLLECHWSHNQVQLSMAALPFYIQFSYMVDLPFCSSYKSNEQRKGSKICWSRLPRILHEDDHVGWAHTRECGQHGNPQLSWYPHLRSMFVAIFIHIKCELWLWMIHLIPPPSIFAVSWQCLSVSGSFCLWPHSQPMLNLASILLGGLLPP